MCAGVQVQGGHKLLSAASVEKMTRPEKSNYALGIGVQTIDGRTVISHGGSIEDFKAHLMYLPAEKITVAVLANVNGPSRGHRPVLAQAGIPVSLF